MREVKHRWKHALASCGMLLPWAVQAESVSDWADRIELSGLIEVEAFMGEGLDNSDQSDIRLATVELGFDAEVNDMISGHLLILHEDDDTEPWEVDEGYATLDMDVLYLDAGRMYVPFGTFETYMISDPFTLELAETREAAFLLGAEYEGLYGSFYLFNGDTVEASSALNGDDTIEHLGFNVGFAAEFDDFSFDVGFDFLSNIADSDLIQSVVGPTVQEYVSAFVLRGLGRYGPFSLIAEYVDTGEFNAADLDFVGAPADMFALNLEAGFDFYFLGNESTVAVGMQWTDEAVELDLPESRFIVGLRSGIMENTNLGLEFRWDEDYAVSDGGTGNDAVTLSAQLQVSF